MAIVTYPPTVPKPLISISRTQAQTFQLVQPLRGAGYVKKLNNDAPVTYDLTWRMSRDQAAQFQAWFYSMSTSGLAMGRNQFQLLIDTEWGQLLHTLQLTPDTFSQTQEAHNVFSYRATAIARRVPIPQWWFDHEDLVNSEFFQQRSLFDVVVNQQLPSAYGDNVIAFIDARNKTIKGIEFSRASTATYIDSSGVLRTAAVNEPRFEGAGLLIERGSRNVIFNSETILFPISGDVTSVSYDKTTLGNFRFVKQVVSGENTAGSFPVAASELGDLNVGDVVTFSAVFKMHSGATARFRLRISNGGLFYADNSFFCDMRSESIANCVHSKKQPFADQSLVMVEVRRTITTPTTGPVSVQLQALQVIGIAHVGCFQLEKKSSASSYMPTYETPLARDNDSISLLAHGGRRIYREYIPLGTSALVTETVPYTGELCPAGHIRLLKVLND